VSRNSFSYLSPRRRSSYASISGSGSFDDLGSASASSGSSGAGGCGGIASRFATLRATPRRKDVRDTYSVKDSTPEASRHMIAVRTLFTLVRRCFLNLQKYIETVYLPSPTAVEWLGFSPLLVCFFFTISEKSMTKLDIQKLMFHDESWKPIYFGVKRLKVKVPSQWVTTSLCRSSDRTQYCRWLRTKPRWVFPAAVPRRTSCYSF